MKGIIDRFEDTYAIIELENLEMLQLPKSALPQGAKEGDVVMIEGETAKLDVAETQKRKHKVEKLMDELFV